MVFAVFFQAEGDIADAEGGTGSGFVVLLEEEEGLKVSFKVFFEVWK